MQIIKEMVVFSDAHGRKDNQDYCLHMTCDDAPDSSAKMSVLCVMDGVSHSNGGDAVKLARKAIRRELTALLGDAYDLLGEDEVTRSPKVFQSLRGAILAVDNQLQKEQILGFRYATTISLAVIFDDVVYAANVGDSPIYLLKLSSEQDVPPTIVPLFQCQNIAGKAVEEGSLSEEEALTHKDSHFLTHNAGGDGLWENDIFTAKSYLGQSSILLLGSDGALAVFPKQTLVQLVEQYRQAGLSVIVDKLFDAVKQSPSTDNFTVVGQWTEDSTAMI